MRAHQVALLLRRDAPEHRVVSVDHALELAARPPAGRRRRWRASASGTPVARGDGPRRSRSAVARDDLDRDALAREVRDRVRGVGAQALREQRRGRAPRSPAGSGRRPSRGGGDAASSTTAAPLAGAARRSARAERLGATATPLRASTSGAPSTSVPRPSRVSAAPLARRRERHLARQRRRPRPGRRPAIACIVPLRRRRRSPRAPPRSLAQVVLVPAVGRLDADHAQAVVGERAGLVEADDVDRGEALDRVEPLRQRARGAPAARPRPRR